MTTPFDFVKSVSQTKKNLFLDQSVDKKTYNAYIINRALSLYPDCLFHANEVNMRSNMDIDMQYQYYLNTIRPMKRYAKWLKRVDDNDLEIVKQYYSFNNEKAKQALSILSKSQIEEIKERMQKGG